MKDHKGLFICKLRAKSDGFEQEFQGSSAALQDFEAMAEKQGWETVFHKRGGG